MAKPKNITFAFNPSTISTHVSVDGVFYQEHQDRDVVSRCAEVEDAIVEICDGLMTIDVKEIESFARILLQTAFPTANISFEEIG